MNKKQIAEALSGIKYPVSIPNEIRVELELNNLVAVYFMFDDQVYFKGAISDDLYYQEGDSILFDSKGLIQTKCKKNCPYFEKEKTKAVAEIIAGDYEFTTDIPHETFTVFEGGELYCLGIVFDMNDISVPLPILRETDHEYYCSDTNYYSGKTSERFNTVTDFLDEYEDADIDMNLCFRFDVTKDIINSNLSASFFIMHQRKGIFKPIFCEQYFPETESKRLSIYLEKHWKTIRLNWKEFDKMWKGLLND